MDEDRFQQARIRMEDTSSQLKKKLEALESRVSDAVETAGNAVEQTVKNVQETVSNVTDTVQSVSEAIDLRKRIEQNPWIAVGSAVVVGFIASRWLGPAPSSLIAALSASQPRREETPSPKPAARQSLNGNGRYSVEGTQASHENGNTPSRDTAQGGIVAQSLNQLGSLVLGSVAGIVGELLRHRFSDQTTSTRTPRSRNGLGAVQK